MRQDTILSLSGLLGCWAHTIPGLAFPPHALLFYGCSYYYLDSLRCPFVQNSRALGSSTFSSKLGFFFYCLGILAGCCHLSQVPITIFHPPSLFFFFPQESQEERHFQQGFPPCRLSCTDFNHCLAWKRERAFLRMSYRGMQRLPPFSLPTH